jgi:hypothetical protein
MKMKIKLLILAMIPLLFAGCDDLFDKGDVEKTYDGPPQVGLFPLQQEVSEISGVATIEVQLIAPHQTSAINVSVSADESSTAQAGVHYNILTPQVTVEPGSSTVDVEIEVIDSGIFPPGTSSRSLRLNIDSADVEIAANLRQSNLIIQRFNRAVTLQSQALDLRVNDSDLLVTGITGQAGDVVVITEWVDGGDYVGAPIVGTATLASNLRGGSIVVDVDGADPTDHVAHIIRGYQISDATLANGEVSEATFARVAATSSVAPIYAVAQFEWNDETYPTATGTVVVDLIEILYIGTNGAEVVSIDLHAVDEEGNIGAFIGISQEDLAFNTLHAAVIIDVVEAVDPDDDAPEREDSTIAASGTFFAMAHLGPAGLDANENRIPAQNPALRTALADGEGVFGFFPVGDDAVVTIVDEDDDDDDDDNG